MIRVKRGTTETLQVTFTTGGAPADDDPVTIGITRKDGSVLVAADTATTDAGTGVYQYALPAQTDLNILTVTWTGATQAHSYDVEIVGGFYLTEAEFRERANMASTATFTEAKFLAARNWFESTFERATGVSWVPRYRRDRLDGSTAWTGGWGTELLLPALFPRRLLSVRVYTDASAYTTFSAPELADVVLADEGIARRQALGTWARGQRNIVVEGEYGMDEPPDDVIEAAAVAIRDRLISNVSGNRVYAVTDERGNFQRISTPGEDRPFGIPEVDAVCNAPGRNYRIPGFA